METKTEAAKRLWQENFQDEAKFVDFYFGEIFSERECRLYYEEASQTAVAHIHLPKYELQLAKGLEVEAMYVSGACSSKPYRGQGIMDKLLRESLQEAGDEVSASFLIPASEEVADYYSKHFDYEPLVYRYLSEQIEDIMTMTPDIPMETSFTDTILFLSYCEEQGHMTRLKHNPEQWVNVGKEYTLDTERSFAYTFKDSEQHIQGIVFAHFLNDNVICVDALYGTAEAKVYLLDTLRSRYPHCQIKAYICTLNKNKGTELYIMFRPLNLLPFLQIYALRNGDLELSFTVKDELIKANSQSFRLSKGSVELIEEEQSRHYSIREFVQSFVFIEHFALLHE